MTIRKSLQANMVLVACIPIVIFAILFFIISLNIYYRVSKTSIQNAAENYEQGVESLIRAQIVENESIANNNTIINLLLKKYNDPAYNLSNDSLAAEQVSENLTQASQNFGGHIIYSVYDLDGNLILSSNPNLVGRNEAYLDAISETLSTSVVDTELELDDVEYAFHIISPVSVKDKYHVGLVVATILPEHFSYFISKENDSYLYSPIHGYLLGNSLTSMNITDMAGETIDAYIKGEATQSGIYRDGKGWFSYDLYGYCVLPDYDWVYIIHQDTALYKSYLKTIPLLLAIALFAFLGLAALTSFFTSKQYTNPIYLLREKMSLASQGDLNVRCEVYSQDEFGELADHFNEMMHIISTNYTELNETKEELEKSQIQLQENYDQIERLAYNDILTGLHNRQAFMKYAKEVFSDQTVKEDKAILFIDLDNFKTVNDTLGHDYGDLLLQHVSNQMNAYITPNDFLARTGGDEFLILRVGNVDEKSLGEFAAKMITIVQQPIQLKEEVVHVSMSVGIAVTPKDGSIYEDLIKHADTAMYAAKKSGKAAYRHYKPSMDQEIESL